MDAENINMSKRGPREIVRLAAQWPEHIPVRIGGETVMLSEATSVDFARTLIHWLEPFLPDERPPTDRDQ